ncbi:hypothetical protein [Herbaspirillum sp. RV1423]|uniref:hypothetical protein n=1 Tax=Herbaspirillum sp. RV1423 TaxID=1443993 RepID=UPI0012DD4F3E|nr:hypothetical protein [Herbaspirillum sp. RV1423]
MKKQKEKNWSGLDMSSLPHESTFSVLLRFSWRNVLNAETLSKICRTNSFRPLNHSLFSLSWRKIHQIADTDWNFPQADEQIIFETLGNTTPIWFREKLCICPICHEHGYHSVWFQFQPLSICPIHACKLSSRCSSCGERLPEFRFSPALFDNPFICPFCGLYISGAESNLRLHLDYREQASSIQEAFDPFVTWLATHMDNLKVLTTMMEQNPAWESAWERWCRPRDFVISIGANFAPLPKVCSTVLYPNVSKFHAIFENAPEREGRYRDPRNAGERLRICSEGYREALATISSALRITEESGMNEISSQVSLDLWHCDLSNLALRLLRMKLEICDWDISRPIDRAEVRGEPAFPIPWQVSRVSSTVLCQIYLAMFCSIVHMLERARKLRFVDLNMLDLRDQSLVASAWYSIDGVMHGLITSLSTTDLPDV